MFNRQLKQQVAALTAVLETERTLHRECIERLRAERGHLEQMLVRVVDAAIARALASVQSPAEPMLPPIVRRADVAPPAGAIPQDRATRVFREIHLGGLGEEAARRRIAERELRIVQNELSQASDDEEPQEALPEEVISV